MRQALAIPVFCLIMGLMGCASEKGPQSTPVPEFRPLKQLPDQQRLIRDPRNQTIRLWEGPGLSDGLETRAQLARFRANDRFADIARTFLEGRAETLKLDKPAQELVLASVRVDRLGMKHVRFSQVYQSIPIWGAQLQVQLGPRNQVVQVRGNYMPSPRDRLVQPVIDQGEALRRVARELGTTACPDCDIRLVLYPVDRKSVVLAYAVRAAPEISKSRVYMIDARTGRIVDQYTDLPR